MTTFALWPLLLCSSGDPAPAARPVPVQGETVYGVSVLLMQRYVDDAEPSDDQLGGALEFDGYVPGALCGWEFGLSSSLEEEEVGGADFEAKVNEIYGGARKTWGEPRSGPHPYLGAGLSFLQAEVDLAGVGSDDDTSFGLYAHGGIYWTFADQYSLGADLKTVVGTDLDFGDADYVQLGVLFGYSL